MAINVFRIGSEVIVGGLPAMVLAVQISGRGVLYKLAWWDGANRREEWCEQCEVKASDPNNRTFIGFK